MSGLLKVRSPDGGFEALLCAPQGAGPWPGLVVVHEIFGLTPWIREVALGFAGQGYLAVAPDLFTHRLQPGFTPEAAVRLMPLVWQVPVEARIVRKAFETALRGHRAQDVEVAWALARLAQGLEGTLPIVEDLRATVEAARRLPNCSGKVGAVGFGFGGTMALALACREPSLGAAVVFYGSAPREADLAAVACPVLGLYAEDDEHTTKDVPRAQAAMGRFGKSFEAVVYNRTGEAFARPGSANYREDRTRDAFARASAFLGKALGVPPAPTTS